MSKKVMVVWFLLICLLLGTIVYIHYKGLDKNLLKIEKEVKKASYNYFDDNNMFPKLNESSIVYIDDLIEKEYLKENEDIKKYCIKSVKVTNKLFVKIFDINKKCEEELKKTNS